MQRQVSGKLLLVVEGDDEDRVLFGHINEPDVTLLVAGGKGEVLAAAHLIHSQQIPAAIALIDRDLDDLTGQSSAYPPTAVATRGYDLVADIVGVNTALLDRVLRVHSRAATEHIESQTGVSATEVAFRLASAISPLRLIAQEHGVASRFRDFPFGLALAADYTPKPWEDLVDIVNSRSQAKLNHSVLRANIEAATARTSGRSELCGGHDVLGAAAAALRQAGARQLSAHHLAASLLAATDCSTVQLLDPYSELQAWAGRYTRSAFLCEVAA
ncbi:hypothetical protein [Agromyces albus]|uniref:DUF4435 domain-containing protein n=1 Tax=Agromyces albus TaxID=205332 RepID=A0A4Q2L967_9MICO|nr:hypothetical protein [Agromyces albus]RXZ72961.1 hypothetical protein ESP51_01685 [Agromyces albus]